MADQIAAFAASPDGAAPPPRSNGAGAAGTADFSTALTSWREIALPTLLAHLAEVGPALVQTQTDGLISRKRLAEQTREFRKLPDDVRADAVKPLLKAYQAEIDALTTRAKRAENVFLGVADRLKGAPDPHYWLELMLEQTASLQDLESLRTQHAALQSETSSLRTRLAGQSSLEAERTRLSEKVASLEKGFEARVAERTSALETSLSARWEERVQNLVSREKDLSRALDVAQSQLKELRAAHAQATEREVAGAEKDARVEELEMQMAADDLRRANERIADLERRNESLRSEVTRAHETSGEEERQAEWERKVEESQEEARRLAAALEGEDARSKRLIEEERRRREEKERALGERVKEVEVLRKRIEGMQDYDEIKRELHIIKYVEFAVQDGADEREAQDAEGSAASAASGAKPLEALLIEKNRKLQDEATTMRVEHEALSKSASASAKQLETLRAEVERLRALNVRLEDDLVNLDTARPSTSQARDKGSMTAEEALAEMDRIGQAAGGSATQARAAPVAERAIPFAPAPASPAPGTPSTATTSGESSILPIITSQRDRFRARNAELEEELRRQFETLTELRNEVKQLQTDNLALYEKVRYLQAYSATAGGAGSSGFGGSSSERHYPPAGVSARHQSAIRIDDDDKYRDKYQASMNPFEAFRGREQIASLTNPFERLLHRVLQVVLGHRRSRLLLIAYAACLHLLVFALLFEIEVS